MRNEIEDLEKMAKALEPGAEVRGNWLSRVAAYTEAFIEGIPSNRSFVTDGNPELIEEFDFRENPTDLETLLQLLKTSVDTPGLNPASGGHLGYIPGGGLYPSALGDLMADVTNRYAGIYFAGPGAVRMENKLIRWMCDLMNYPISAHGNLASGGSIANLIGITTARDAKGITSHKVASSVIYINPQTHHCVHKAIRIAGLGECHLREVPLDERFRMCPDALRQMVEADEQKGLNPFLVVASLGSTDTGAVDPINAIADVAQDHDLWFQVDAAYGGFFILVDELKDRFEGIGRSDSIIIDPHKGMFLPYGLGAVLVKDSEQLARSHFYKANYMQDAQNAPEISPADVSPELTKHFRGLRMWLPMQLFGLAPFRAGLKEKWMLARYFRSEIIKRGFEAGPDPELSVVIYRYNAPGLNVTEFNQALTKAVQADGTIFISSTLIDGIFWLRLAVLSFRTHLREIELLLDILERERDRLLRESYTIAAD